MCCWPWCRAYATAPPRRWCGISGRKNCPAAACRCCCPRLWRLTRCCCLTRRCGSRSTARLRCRCCCVFICWKNGATCPPRCCLVRRWPSSRRHCCSGRCWLSAFWRRSRRRKTASARSCVVLAAQHWHCCRRWRWACRFLARPICCPACWKNTPVRRPVTPMRRSTALTGWRHWAATGPRWKTLCCWALPGSSWAFSTSCSSHWGWYIWPRAACGRGDSLRCCWPRTTGWAFLRWPTACTSATWCPAWC